MSTLTIASATCIKDGYAQVPCANSTDQPSIRYGWQSEWKIKRSDGSEKSITVTLLNAKTISEISSMKGSDINGIMQEETTYMNVADELSYEIPPEAQFVDLEHYFAINETTNKIEGAWKEAVEKQLMAKPIAHGFFSQIGFKKQQQGPKVVGVESLPFPQTPPPPQPTDPTKQGAVVKRPLRERTAAFCRILPWAAMIVATISYAAGAYFHVSKQ